MQEGLEKMEMKLAGFDKKKKLLRLKGHKIKKVTKNLFIKGNLKKKKKSEG